jgi:hypothetical protein
MIPLVFFLDAYASGPTITSLLILRTLLTLQSMLYCRALSPHRTTTHSPDANWSTFWFGQIIGPPTWLWPYLGAYFMADLVVNYSTYPCVPLPFLSSSLTFPNPRWVRG